MTVADLERATTRIAAVEQRNVRFVFTSTAQNVYNLADGLSVLQELLRAEIESVKSGSQHVDKSVSSARLHVAP